MLFRSEKQTVTAGNHHVAVGRDELGVALQDVSLRTKDECGHEALGLGRERREKHTAVAPALSDCFVGKPAKTEVFQIRKETLGVQQAGVLLINAEDLFPFTPSQIITCPTYPPDSESDSQT